MKGYSGLSRPATLKEQIVAGLITTGVVLLFNWYITK